MNGIEKPDKIARKGSMLVRQKSESSHRVACGAVSEWRQDV